MGAPNRCGKSAETLAAIVLLAIASTTAIAQSPQETAIRGVIARQLEAMNRGDAVTSFAWHLRHPVDIWRCGQLHAHGRTQLPTSLPIAQPSFFETLTARKGWLIQRVLIESNTWYRRRTL